MTPATLDVPDLTKDRIEREARRLLTSYSEHYGPITRPAIPVEPILELHLKLGLTICRLRELLGADVLGALSVERREVMVDEQLDPDEFPQREGRYRFTLAHEIGHWQLHRQLDGCPWAPEQLVPRRRLTNRRIERQADYFAACLLMPRTLVLASWSRTMPGRVVTLAQLEPRRQEMIEDEIVRRRFVPTTPEQATNMVLERVALPMAEEFQVSPIAMRIRLEELKLLVR